MPNATPRLLIVDDDPINASILKRVLARAGLQAEVAGDGESALELLAQGRAFDTILLDWLLPGINGIQVLRHLKADPKLKQIPVVAERVQTDTYLACAILAETLGPMLDNFVRDHLLERMENHLSTRILNAYYPRLGLAPGQRFASKGGYMVHFADAKGSRLLPDGDWMVP